MLRSTSRPMLRRTVHGAANENAVARLEEMQRYARSDIATGHTEDR